MPADKGADRALRNFYRATTMLGHLCALYDSGIFEAARLMANLITQLAVSRRRNVPLLSQIGLMDRIRIVVDEATLGSRITSKTTYSPLVALISGIKRVDGNARPAAVWLPASRRPPPFAGFVEQTVDFWLVEPVIPTATGVISRARLIECVRDQDGGAHVDEDLTGSDDYVDLVDSFPMSKRSSIEIYRSETLVWDLLPPVTLPILRQIALELLNALWWYIDQRIYLPTVVCKFEGPALRGAFVPEGYPKLDSVYGVVPTLVPRGGTPHAEHGANAANAAPDHRS